MTDMPCSVIKDLLPLYVDKACSEESILLVEQHLASCSHCKEQLEGMRGGVLSPSAVQEPEKQCEQEQEERVIQSLAKAWHRTKWFAWIKGLVAATIVFVGVVFLYIWLTEWKLVEIPATSFEASELYQLSDGTITYRLKAIDGYEVRSITLTGDEEGNAYVIGHRPFISERRDVNFEIGRMANSIHQFNPNTQFVFDLNNKHELKPQPKIKALYYGTKENNFLIWKEGMSLPGASTELEEYWDRYNARVDASLNEQSNNKN